MPLSNHVLHAIVASLLVAGGVFAMAETPYAMPSVGPMYPPPPWSYRNCRVLLLTLQSDPEVVRGMVPPPLVPNHKGVVLMWLGEMHAVEPFQLDYLEFGLAVPVDGNGIKGAFCTNLYLNDDTAIAGGREIWGWPKKMATMTLHRDGQTIKATATRGGVEIISAIFGMANEAPIEDRLQHFINFKIIPSVQAGHPPEVAQLTDCPTLRQTHLLKDGKATLTLRSSASDALGRIPVREVLKAQYSECDFTLPMGELLHDYLASPPAAGTPEK